VARSKVSAFAEPLAKAGGRKGRERGCGSAAGGGLPRETPLEILKRRYAAGEITREDFERMEQDIA